MARIRRTPPRATWRANSACARGAQPARFPARERELARPRGVQPASLRGVQPAPFGAPLRVQGHAAS